MEKRYQGMTLIEILVVMATLAVLMVFLIGSMDPIALVNKANDSRRKSDLNKFKTAFEEFFYDKGRYPAYYELNGWNVVSNCNKEVEAMSKYLKKWSCDPHGKPYMMMVGNGWFKVMANLDNKKDKDIPDGWYSSDFSSKYSVDFSRDEANYGVSSSNILWYQSDNP